MYISILQHRRAFLAGIATTTIAGCSGDTDDVSEPKNDDSTETNTQTETSESTPTEESIDIETDPGPAEFAVYQASFIDDDEKTVNSTGNLEITIGNRGGEPGAFAVDGFFAEDSEYGSFSGELTDLDSNVASGETATLTSETITLSDAGRFDVRVGVLTGGLLPIDESANAEVVIKPLRGTRGDVFPVRDEGAVKMSVENVQFQESIYEDASFRAPGFGSDDRAELKTSDPDTVFAGVEIMVKSTYDSYLSIQMEFAGNIDINSGKNLSFPYIGDTIKKGETKTGFVLYEVNKSSIPGAEVSIGPGNIVWDLGLDQVEFPEFELVESDVPEEYTSNGESVQLSFTIQNTSDVAGTFRGGIEWGDNQYDKSDLEYLLKNNMDLTAEIPPGDTATVSVQADHDNSTERYYRFNPFNETFTISPE